MHNYLELQLISSQIWFKCSYLLKGVKIMLECNMVLILFVD